MLLLASTDFKKIEIKNCKIRKIKKISLRMISDPFSQIQRANVVPTDVEWLKSNNSAD